MGWQAGGWTLLWQGWPVYVVAWAPWLLCASARDLEHKTLKQAEPLWKAPGSGNCPPGKLAEEEREAGNWGGAEVEGLRQQF